MKSRALPAPHQTGAALALALAATAAPALAQDAVTGSSLASHATFTNVGVDILVSGDANRNASAALEVDVGGTGFKPAHRLSRVSDTHFVGSAFFLPPGTAYQVRVTLSDPDGVTKGVLTGSGTTRTSAVPVSAGATYHVSKTGDDGATGLAAAPFASIARGLRQAQPGDTVLVHAGAYHEEIDLPRGGAPGSPITLRAAGDGPAVLDGAEPSLKDASAWTDSGSGVYTAPVAATRYVSVDGLRLWRYESLADLRSLALGTNGGFFFDGSAVHVKLPGSATPSGHEIQVSTLSHALWLASTPHVVIQGLTIRCYGAEEYSEGIMVRDGSHQVWIVENTFENVMPGIWVKNEVDDLTIRGNSFSDRGLTEFRWQDVKDQGGMESGAIAIDNAYDGQGIVFEKNSVHDSFDGLHICGDTPMSHPNNADVIGNSFEHLGDDGMETDGECSNIRVIGNRFKNSLTAVSTAPAVTGPTYVIRNLATHLDNVAKDSQWMTRFMKFNVGDDRPSGDVFAYHNTAVVYAKEQSAFTVTDDSLWTEVHVANNIFVGTDYALYYQNTGNEPFFEDYDLLYSTSGQIARYQETNYATIADYQAATGQCTHGIEAAPGFADETAGDYRLASASPAVDKGLVIPGINDGYGGAAPDLGAFELGTDLPSWPEAGTVGGGATGGGGGSGAGGGAHAGGGGATGESHGCVCVIVGASQDGALSMAVAGSALLVLSRIGRRARRRSR